MTAKIYDFQSYRLARLARTMDIDLDDIMMTNDPEMAPLPQLTPDEMMHVWYAMLDGCFHEPS